MERKEHSMHRNRREHAHRASRERYGDRHGSTNRHHVGGSHGSFTSVGPRLPHVIDETNGSNAHVTRTYRSTPSDFANTQGQDYDAVALSFSGQYDGVNDTIAPLIKAGGPATGSDIGVTFPNLPEEYYYYSKVFRYVKLTKMQIRMKRMVPIFQASTGSDAGTGGNRDLGVVVIRPWAGQPGIASFTDGLMTNGDQLVDHSRYKLKQMKPMASSADDPGSEIILCVEPISVVNLDENNSDSAANQVTYVKTGAVDVDRFRTLEENFNSYGWIMYWWHPGIVQDVLSDFFTTNVSFDLEFTYYGLRPPASLPAPELPEGKVYESSREAQLVASGLLKGVEIVPDPPRPPMPPIKRIPTSYPNTPDGIEIPDLKKSVVAEYVQVEKNQTKPVIKQAASRPNTPQRK